MKRRSGTRTSGSIGGYTQRSTTSRHTGSNMGVLNNIEEHYLHQHETELLDLSMGEKVKYERMREDYLQRHLDGFEFFLREEKGKVDKKKWRQLRKKENIKVCKEKYGCQELRYIPKNRPVPTILTVGSVPGTLNDILYAVSSVNDETMRLKTSYIKDDVIDSKLLATIKKPTEEQPFDSCTLKWCILDRGKSLGWHREFVFMEATGTTFLPSAPNEIIGYHLVHSIPLQMEIPSHFATKTPTQNNPNGQLLQVIRGEWSFCYLFRQPHRQHQVVEIFMKGFVDPRGDMMDEITIQRLGSKTFVASARLGHCADMKKLVWYLNQNAAVITKASVISTSTTGASTSTETTGIIINNCCDLCRKEFSNFTFKRHKKHMCSICCLVTCGRCVNSKKMSFQMPNGTIERHSLEFCIRCISEANKLDAFSLAIEEIRQAQEEEYTTTISSKSCSIDNQEEEKKAGRRCSSLYGQRKSLLLDPRYTSTTSGMTSDGEEEEEEEEDSDEDEDYDVYDDEEMNDNEIHTANTISKATRNSSNTKAGMKKQSSLRDQFTQALYF